MMQKRPCGTMVEDLFTGISRIIVHMIMRLLFFLQVDLLKHAIPDPSSPALSRLQISEIGPEMEFKDKLSEGNEYMATPIFVHSK